MIVEQRNLYNYCSLLVLTLALNDTLLILLVRRFSSVHSVDGLVLGHGPCAVDSPAIAPSVHG